MCTQGTPGLQTDELSDDVVVGLVSWTVFHPRHETYIYSYLLKGEGRQEREQGVVCVWRNERET